MNDLYKKIEPFIKSKSHPDLDLSSLENATTNIQNATAKDIVFYRLFANEKSLDAFKKRSKNANWGLLITTEDPKLNGGEKYIVVDESDFLKLQKIICDEFYPYNNEIKIIGITGTNGKTTTVNLARQIAWQNGVKAISLGTLGVIDHNGNNLLDDNSTTPSYVGLRNILYKFKDNYEFLFMEVSSHAIDQKRLLDLKLVSAGWTSFSQDHLDYHGTEEEYFLTKLKISDYANKNLFVPSLEKNLFNKIKEQLPEVKYSTSLSDKQMASLPFEFKVRHNISNLELAIALVKDNLKIFSVDVARLELPKGRFNAIKFKNSFVVIDYAHTPDGLLKICESLKESYSDYELITIFGCGGDRDRAKRPLMGEAVCKFSDYAIASTDNPRSEDPEAIIEDIKPGLSGRFEIIVDRKEAIEQTLNNCSDEDKKIILIAGKGHEEYQEINGEKIFFSDFVVVNDFKEKVGLS